MYGDNPPFALEHSLSRSCLLLVADRSIPLFSVLYSPVDFTPPLAFFYSSFSL